MPCARTEKRGISADGSFVDVVEISRGGLGPKKKNTLAMLIEYRKMARNNIRRGIRDHPDQDPISLPFQDPKSRTPS